MTNREWLNSLSDEELAKILNDCTICPCFGSDYCEQCVLGNKEANNRRVKWLKAEFGDAVEKCCRNCEHAYLASCKGCCTIGFNTYENFELRKELADLNRLKEEKAGDSKGDKL